MAMLAEPRRRKRYNLCPRGKALYEDDSRFGTKMLEKMGWSKGRGLGANEDGSQEFVRIRFKNDAEGLGYENRDDQWTIHEEGFNGLLKELNGDENPATNETNGNASESEEETRPMGFGFKAEPKPKTEPPKLKTLKENISGVSLEEKSKISKARVHYKKFTRGKDLAQYSEKDLANIFGKKATEDFVVPVIAPIEPTEEPEDKPVNDNFAGVQTVSTGLSVTDYFRLKMEALKNKSKANHLKQETTEDMDDKEQQVEDHDAVKKKKKKSKKQVTEVQEEVIEIKAKESKKNMSKELTEELAVGEAEQEEAPKKKKSKFVQEVPEEMMAVGEAEQEEAPKKKKKKKSKEVDIEMEVELAEEKKGEIIETSTQQKKKNKSKQDVQDELQEEVTETSTQLKKKKKSEQDKEVTEQIERERKTKRAKKEAIEPEDTKGKKNLKLHMETEQTDENAAPKKIGKRAGEQEIPPPQEETEETNPPKRKKKKKDKQDEAEHLKKEEAKETTTKKQKKIKNINENSAQTEEKKKQTKRKKARDTEYLNFEENSAENSQKKHNSNVSAKCDTTNLKLDPDNYLSYEQLIQLRDSFNICTISSFCAEKFHLFDMKAFKNSSLPQIVGYNVDENIQLNVVQTNNDALRIISLWEGTSNKYTRDKDAANKLKRTKHKAAIRANKRRQVFSVI